MFSELGVDKLNKEGGMKTLISIMDEIYKKDDLSEAYEVYTEFNRFKRNGTISMENYVIEFEELYNKTCKYKMTLPTYVLAFKLLEGANLDHKDRQLILTGVNLKEEGTLFKQMSTSLKKFFGKQSIPASDHDEQLNIKVYF